MADRTIYGSDIAGGVFTGGPEADKLTLAGGGSFDFTSVILSGYDSIMGSTSSDYISLTASQLTGITLIDGGSMSLYGNSLFLHGMSLDLRNKSIVNFSWVELADDGASVVTTDKNLALRISGYESRNDSLTLEGASFTETELRTLHDKGIDTIYHGNGQVSVDYAPVLTGLDEARRTVNKGQSVFLDAASDVSVSDDFGGVKNLSINVRSSGENYAFDQGRVELTRTSRVSFSVATMGNDGVIAVDGVEIGTYEQMSEESLWFAFNRNVSNDAVAQVIRAIKYTNDRSYGSAATIEVSVKARDTGSRESSRTMTFDVPAASIDPGYPSRPSTGFNIFGTSAKDTIVGTIGNDTLAGGLGNDTLAGGYGNDTFVFDSKLGSKNIDRIADFSVPNDTIELSRSIFKKAGKVGLLNKSAFYVGAKAHDKDDRIVYKKTTGDSITIRMDQGRPRLCSLPFSRRSLP